MMGVLITTLILTPLLLAIAVLHAYWGLGGLWPARTVKDLARLVVGAPGINRMPPRAACFAVAILLALVALWPMMMAGAIASPLPVPVMSTIGWLMAAVFVARGVAAYIPAARRLAPEEPFASMDRWFYGPLCVAIGSGFVVYLTRG